MKTFLGTNKQKLLRKTWYNKRYFVETKTCFKNEFKFNLLQPFPIAYSVWLYSLVVQITKKYEEDFILQKNA